MIVVDTNILAYLLLTSEHSSQTERAFQRDPLWAAPLLWRSEFRSVLSFYVRKSHLTIAQAVTIMEEADVLLGGREYAVSSYSVLGLVAGSRCSAYDCEFVALAQDLSTSLLTADKLVLAEFPGVAISLNDYLDDKEPDGVE